jgi:hypothetical protein
VAVAVAVAGGGSGSGVGSGNSGDRINGSTPFGQGTLRYWTGILARQSWWDLLLYCMTAGQ